MSEKVGQGGSSEHEMQEGACVAFTRSERRGSLARGRPDHLSLIVSHVSDLENCPSVIRLDEIFGLRALTRVDVCVHDSKSQRNQGDFG